MSGQPQDLMSYLLEKYQEAEPASSTLREPVEHFVAFCKKLLTENRPIAMEHLSDGLSLRLQDSTIVTFAPEAQAMSDAVGFIGMGKGGIGKGTTPSNALGITGHPHGG